MTALRNPEIGSPRAAETSASIRRTGFDLHRFAASALLMVGGLAFASAALAYTATTTPTSKRPAAAPRPAAAAPSRMSAPVVTVRRTAPGQTGYVHYFLITGPDGEPETQVGLELPGDRIAWSFPNAGVSVSPFIASGEVMANGAAYEIEHLYGIRPFADAKAMMALRSELEARVLWWVEQKVPYCDEEHPTHDLCVSCLGFVLRVLYPGESPDVLALPGDFRSARKDTYTTEDFLMYLAGVRLDAARQSRLKRIKALKVPKTMREELVRIASAPAVATKAPRVARAKSRASGRSLVQSPKRATPRRGS